MLLIPRCCLCPGLYGRVIIISNYTKHKDMSHVCLLCRNMYTWMTPSIQPTKKEHNHGGAICRIQRHGYCKRANILASTSPQWVSQGQCRRVLLIIVNWPRKIINSELINFILVFIPSQLNCPQIDGIMLPSRSPPVESPRLSLLYHARVFLVGYCV